MDTNLVTFPGLGISMSIDRVAFELFGRPVYWYGIIIAIGFILAAIYAYKRAPQFGIEPDNFLDQLIIAAILGIICTRAYYVIFNYDLYRGDFASIFRIWDGGLAIYGGIIGGVIAIIIYCKIKKIKVGAMLDLCCLAVLIGQIIGRWGNFFNKEAHGGATQSFLRMGIYENGQYMEVHPTFLYESVWNLIGFVFLHIYSKKRKRRYDGQLFLMYVAWYGLGRGVIEGLRTDSLMLFGTGLRVSQVLGFASFLIAMLVMLYNEIFKHHKPEDMAVYKMEHAEELGKNLEVSEEDAEDIIQNTIMPDNDEPDEFDDIEDTGQSDMTEVQDKSDAKQKNAEKKEMEDEVEEKKDVGNDN